MSTPSTCLLPGLGWEVGEDSRSWAPGPLGPWAAQFLLLPLGGGDGKIGFYGNKLPRATGGCRVLSVPGSTWQPP